MPPKVIWWSPMIQICNLWGQIFSLQMPPDRKHLGISLDPNLHVLGWSKMPKFAPKKCFAPNAPQSYLVVSHDPNLQSMGSKMPNLGVKNAKICKKLFLLQMPPGVIWVPWPKFTCDSPFLTGDNEWSWFVSKIHSFPWFHDMRQNSIVSRTCFKFHGFPRPRELFATVPASYLKI